MTGTVRGYRHVDYRWDNSVADGLSPAERLVYRSNCLGADQRITNTGGGNTSSKVTEKDPLTDEAVDVMWVKGSGGDLRTSTLGNFASLYLDRLKALQGVYEGSEVTGLKTPAEDAMVGMYRHTVFNLNPRASSIDTPIHAFVPYKHVDHMHPNAAIAIAACESSREITREVYGDDVLWTPWQRPGFDLGLVVQELCRDNPSARGLMLGHHGTIVWSDDDKECYERSLELIERAGDYIDSHDRGEMTFGGQRYRPLSYPERRDLLHGLLPWLRGRVSEHGRMIATVQHDDEMLRFVNSVDAPRLAELGTSCPDHFIRTKVRPMFVDWDPQTEDAEALRDRLTRGLERYRRDYADYYDECKRPESPPMREPVPTVMLVPGVGMVAWGKNKSESRVTAEFYRGAVDVMRGAEAIDRYVGLPPQETFDIEYWSLEDAKLRRLPLEKEMARKVVVVVGAGSGIGRAAARRLAAEGGHVVCADLDPKAASATATELADTHGMGIGVSGSGISGSGSALGLPVNVTDRASVRAMFEAAVAAYGGVDSVVVTAGAYPLPGIAGRTADGEWQRTFDVNVTGGYVVADEAFKIWLDQGLDGSLVLTSSANAVVPKSGSLAYDTSKAAVNHLVRELAMEMAPLVRVNGVAPATVVSGSLMFPRDRVVASLAKYSLPQDDNADDDTLRQALADFYAGRNLLNAHITPEDVAEVAYRLIGDGFSVTTGQVVAVDGGLPEAFLR